MKKMSKNQLRIRLEQIFVGSGEYSNTIQHYINIVITYNNKANNRYEEEFNTRRFKLEFLIN